MSKGGNFSLSIILTALMLPAVAIGESANSSAIQLQTFKTHSRLSFQVDSGVEAQWKETKAGFEILFKGIGLSDVGAPFGAESGWVREQGRLKDSRFGNLRFQEIPDGLKVVGSWVFPKGVKAPADPKMEHFQYRDKTNSRYMIDFWLKPGPTVAELRATQYRNVRIVAIHDSEERAKKTKDRRLASEKKKNEAENIAGFCQRAFSENGNIFLTFLPVHDKVNLSRWYNSSTPDSEYTYLRPTSTTRDAQYARLALNLYSQGSHGLAIRTLDFLDAEYPNSDFRMEMKFLRANALLKLGHEADALRLLGDLLIDVKEAPFSLHAGMFLAMREANNGANLAALERFLWLIQYHSAHRLAWVFHLGAAEALYTLKQRDRAAKEYQWVMTHAPEKAWQAEAASRMGDLHLSRFQYESALASYFQALNYYQAEMKNFPSLHINRAETLYWLGQYDRAGQAFEAFLNDYPSHPAGWRAALRLGEIHGRAGKIEESRKRFYETVNRFPFSPGATLARLQLVPCADHAGFDLAAAERFYKTEALAFDGNGEVVMDRYRDYRGLSEVRALVTLGQNDEAVNVAVKELQANAQSEARHIVADLLAQLFRKSILSMLSDGKKYDALVFYQQKFESIPKGKEIAPINSDYLLKLSQAATDLGFGSLARKLSDSYVKAQAEVQRAPATAEDEFDLKLRKSEEHFTQAKALWITAQMNEVGQIREHLKHVAEESEYSYEREIILGLIDEKEEKYASALNHAQRAQLLCAEKAANEVGERARISYWVGTLQARAGMFDIAVEIYRKLEVQREAITKQETGQTGSLTAKMLGVADVPAATDLLMMQGELLSLQKKWGEASVVYARAVQNGIGGNQAMYEYVRALRSNGDAKSQAVARETLVKLAQSKTDDFWKKLASEALGGVNGERSPANKP